MKFLRLCIERAEWTIRRRFGKGRRRRRTRRHHGEEGWNVQCWYAKEAWGPIGPLLWLCSPPFYLLRWNLACTCRSESETPPLQRRRFTWEKEREREALNGSVREARQARLNRDWWVCVCWKRKQCRVVRKKRVFFPSSFFFVGYCSTKLPIGKFVVSNIGFRLWCWYLRFVFTWHDLYLVISYFFLSKKNKKMKKNTILILKFYQNFVFYNFKLLIFIFKLLKSFLRYAIKNVLFFFLKFKILYIIFLSLKA